MSIDEAARAAYRAQKEALQAVLDLSVEARAEALSRLAAEDPALAEVVARRLAASDTAPSREPDVPTLPDIPRYHVEAEIGRGGMGRVYLARRADAADAQRLAIKQVRSDGADAELLRRFEAERRMLSRLDHPHIVPLLDAGADAQGRPFLVTPYVEGEPIDAWCRARHSDVRSVVRLVRDVAAALAHAHRQLIVHRDLKPANVLVDAQGRVRLLDFGIAKMLDAAPDVTAAGTSLMTLRYAAPEQVSGGPLGVGCDLYAAGVLLYELLAGHSPYRETREPAALIHAIAHDEAPPLPARAANGESLPGDLAAVVATLLRKKPEQRYRSADALVDELERWLAGEPLQAMSSDRGYRARRWLRRRWPWVAAAGVLLALGAGHTWQLDRQLQATQRERDKAQAVADYFVKMFQVATPRAARDGELSARELLRGGAEQLKAMEAHADSPQAVAALLIAVSQVHDDLGLTQEAVDLAERAVAALRSADDPIGLADALRNAASIYYAMDRNDDYLARSDEALQLLERSGKTDDALYPRLLANVGFGHFLRGDYERAWPYVDRGREHFAARLPESRSDYMRALTNAGGMASIAGDQPRAFDLMREAERQAALQQPRSVAQELFIARNLGVVLREMGRLDESLRYYDTAVSGALRDMGEGHPDVASALLGRGETRLARGEAEAALADLDQARDHAVRAHSEEHGQITDIDGMRALALMQLSRRDEARALLERNLARRADEPILEVLPRLEAVALATIRCDAADETEARAQLAAMKSVSNWQREIATGWRCLNAAAAPAYPSRPAARNSY